MLAVGVATADMVMPGDDERSARPPRRATTAAKGGEAASSPQGRAVRRAAQAGATGRSRSADYHADHTLRVLIGAPRADTPRGRRAFFFVGTRYIGRDASTPSLQLRPGRQLDREITLVYTLYEPGDTRLLPDGRRDARALPLDRRDARPARGDPGRRAAHAAAARVA